MLQLQTAYLFMGFLMSSNNVTQFVLTTLKESRNTLGTNQTIKQSCTYKLHANVKLVTAH